MLLAHDAAGMTDFIVPQADSWEKQMGEMAVLLKTGPVPNPQKIQMQQQLDAAASTIPRGAIVPPEQVAQLAQATQQMAAMPDMVSTVPIDPQCDDHVTESACCLHIINGPEGRKLKNGSMQERDAFQNLRLHYLEHDKLAKQNQPPAPQKPMSVSANVKDMPPDAAAAELNKRGLPATPQSVAATQSLGG